MTLGIHEARKAFKKEEEDGIVIPNPRKLVLMPVPHAPRTRRFNASPTPELGIKVASQ